VLLPWDNKIARCFPGRKPGLYHGVVLCALEELRVSPPGRTRVTRAANSGLRAVSHTTHDAIGRGKHSVLVQKSHAQDWSREHAGA
jgi:hypothetical protein